MIKKIKEGILKSQSGGIFIALLVICFLISTQTSRFLTETNLMVIFNQVSVNAILLCIPSRKMEMCGLLYH